MLLVLDHLNIQACYLCLNVHAENAIHCLQHLCKLVLKTLHSIIPGNE